MVKLIQSYRLFLFIAAALLLAAFAPPVTNHPNLVGYWSFNNNNVTVDQSANNLETTNHGAPIVKGKKGNALSFNGKEFLEVNYSPVTDKFENGITISAWILRRESDAWNTIVSREIGTGWSEYFGLAVVKNKALFSIDADGKHYKNIKSSFDVPLNKWTHLAGTYNNKVFKLFVDGKEAASDTCNLPFSFQDKNPMVIGGNTNTQGKEWIDLFYGSIDEVRIYNRALDNKEIQRIK
ncbi:MAG TPA: LamG domain-containing protein [Segetibacter sp.]